MAIKIHHCNTLPIVREPNCIYFVKGETASDVIIYATGNNAELIRHTLTRTEVASLLENNGKGIIKVATLPSPTSGWAGMILCLTPTNVPYYCNGTTWIDFTAIGDIQNQVNQLLARTTNTNSGDETNASILAKLGLTALSGTNTGDETAASILAKLGLTALSGTNTGDETAAGIKSKLGISSLSGANTGDETAATIRSKLGISSLSGVNTGDETNATIITKLGFTPVQQGGGADQGTNKLYIGWSASSTLKLQVDATSFGDVWPMNISGNAATATEAWTAKHVNGLSTDGGTIANTYAQQGLCAMGQGNGAAMMTFHRPGLYAAQLGIDTDNVLKYGGWSAGEQSWAIAKSDGGTYTLNITGNAASATTAYNLDSGGNYIAARYSATDSITLGDRHAPSSFILYADYNIFRIFSYVVGNIGDRFTLDSGGNAWIAGALQSAGNTNPQLNKGSVSSGTVTFNRATGGDVQKVIVAGPITVALTGFPAAGTYGCLLLEVVNGGSAVVTFPNIKWILPTTGAAAASITAYLTAIGRTPASLQVSGTDFLYFWSTDGGVTINGKIM